MTEVQHGPKPTFRRQITGDGYELKIVGYNTTDRDRTAGGAVDWKFDSARAAKRLNESSSACARSSSGRVAG